MAICRRCNKEVVVMTGVHIPGLGINNMFFSLGGAKKKRDRYEDDIKLIITNDPGTQHVLHSFMVMVKDMFQKLKAADEYIEKQMKQSGEDANADRELANSRLNRSKFQKSIDNIDNTLKTSETLDAKVKRWTNAGLKASREEAADWLDSMDRDYLKLEKIKELASSAYLVNNLRYSSYIDETVVKSVHQVCALFRLQYFDDKYEIGLGTWLRNRKISDVPLPVIKKRFPLLWYQENKRCILEYDICLCTEKHPPKTQVALQGIVGTVKGLFKKLKEVDAYIEKKKGDCGKDDEVIANDRLDRANVQKWIDDTENMLKTEENFDAMIKRWNKAGLEASKMEAANWLDSVEHDYSELEQIWKYKQTDFLSKGIGFGYVRGRAHKVCTFFQLKMSRSEEEFYGEYTIGFGSMLRDKKFNV